ETTSRVAPATEDPKTTPPVELTATLRVVDPAGAAISGAKVLVAFIPHQADAFYPFREPPRSDTDGKTTFRFSAKDASEGFAPTAEQLEEQKDALAGGYRQMRDATTPAEPDLCVLFVTASAEGRRESSVTFSFSISELSAGSRAWSGDVVLPPLPRDPILTLKIIDKETKRPIEGAIVRLAPVSPTVDWVVGRSDHNGMVRQLPSFPMDEFRVPILDGAHLDTLMSVDGFPLVTDRNNAIMHLTIAHFPEHAPAYRDFVIQALEEPRVSQDVAYKEYRLDPGTAALERVVELAQRQYFELELIDFDTKQRIDDESMLVKTCFLYCPPFFPPSFRMQEFVTAQTYPVQSGLVRVALDQPDGTGLVIKIQPKDNRGDGRIRDYIPHFVPGVELPAPNGRLTVTFSREPGFTILIKELDADPANPPIFVRSSVNLVHSQVTHHVGKTETHVWERTDEEVKPQRLDLVSHRHRFGSIDFHTGWESADLQSWELEALTINTREFPGYEILGPDKQVLAPWSDSPTRGTFTEPLVLFKDGTTQVGEPDGTLVFYVRWKK
ncbi:MAG TPA: hypothetical protein VM509_09940, partial [Planctomycetota bacterium]|nr:hypothetical protein [Planctomycetota bacterium]